MDLLLALRNAKLRISMKITNPTVIHLYDLGLTNVEAYKQIC